MTKLTPPVYVAGTLVALYSGAAEREESRALSRRILASGVRSYHKEIAMQNIVQRSTRATLATITALMTMGAATGTLHAQSGAARGAGPAVVKVDYSAPPGAPYEAIAVTVPSPAGHTLAGTLTLPKGASRAHPVAAIVTITGSGPEDRDEALPGVDGYRPFRQFADSLGRRGIAVLRMDDRGYGESTGKHKGATSADFADDIRAGLAYLRTRPEIDAKRLGLLGHSEGGLDSLDFFSRTKTVYLRASH